MSNSRLPRHARQDTLLAVRSHTIAGLSLHVTVADPCCKAMSVGDATPRDLASSFVMIFPFVDNRISYWSCVDPKETISLSSDSAMVVNS